MEKYLMNPLHRPLPNINIALPLVFEPVQKFKSIVVNTKINPAMTKTI
jgi:hypothetical protein